LTKEKQVVAIVDDDPSVLKGIKRVLEASNFSTSVFASAEEFLGGESPGKVACIVLDIHLDGISGIDLRRRLAEMGSRTPVIFITSDDSAAIRKEATDTGCAAYLQKPIPGRVLIDAIRTATLAA
jgi:FixJ family two-component response regulator